MNARIVRNLLFTVYCLLFTVLVGCASIEGQGEVSEYYGPNDGQFTMFLNGPDKATLDITFDLSAVNIVTEDGTSKEVMSTPLRINSLTVSGHQILLGEKPLPEGRYAKLKLTIKEALIKRKDSVANLALPAADIEIPISVTINRNQNMSLFLKWDADASVTDGFQFNPAFIAKGPRPELSTLQIYVTNEDSNNVSVINRQSDEVVATVLVGKKPKGVATGLRRQYLRVYVVNSMSNSMSVIDPTINKVETEVPLRFGREPEGIAVATVSPEKEFIFVTNYGSNTLSVIDALTYQEMQKVNVGSGPVAVAVDPPAETLLGAKFLDFEDLNTLRSYRENFFNIYVANRNSREVTVLKFDIANKRVLDLDKDIMNITVEWNPVALFVDYQRGKVYVANYGFDNLSVIDIPEIVRGNKTGAVSAISGVGHSNTGVIADPSLDRIYLLKEVPGEILFIRPMLEDQSPVKTLTPIVGTIPVGRAPRSLLLDPEGRKIYTVNRGSNNVSIIDKTTRREEKIVPVGRKPYGIAVIPH